MRPVSKFQVRVGGWSVVKTADGKGLSISPMEIDGLHDYEIVVTVGNGDFVPGEKSLRINTYISGVDEPVMNVNLPKVKWEDYEDEDEDPFAPTSNVNLTDMLNDIRDKQSTEYRKARMLGLDLMLNRKIGNPKKPKKNKAKK